MEINPLWWVCIFIRILLIVVIRYLFKNYKNSLIYKVFLYILLIIGLGFLYKGYFSSNKEIQFSKVFWHETRFVHGILYLLSFYYLIINNINLTSVLLLTDILFSITYRIITNQ